MLIGTNNTNNNMFKKFKNLNKIKRNNFNIQKNVNDFTHTNPENNKEMKNKTLDLLNKRLQNNEITIEEFNRQCNKLSKYKN